MKLTRRIFVFLLILWCPLLLFAQDNKQKALDVTNNPDLLYGQGWGATQKEADQQALSDLISKISVSVESSVNINTSEIRANQETESKSALDQVVQTYSWGELKNTQSIIVEQGPQWQVMRYIDVKEIEKVFEHRKDIIFDYVRSAQRYEQKGAVDDALRYYYWAFCLLKSLQNPDEVTFNDQGMERHLKIWIPEQMNDIFTGLKTEVSEVDGTEADLYITYNDKPVNSLTFRYWNGSFESAPVLAQNGIAHISMQPDYDWNLLKLSYEYEFAGQTSQDRNGLESVVKLFNKTPFPKSHANIRRGTKKELKVTQASFQKAVEQVSQATNAVMVDKDATYQQAIKEITNALKTKKGQSVSHLFTPEGYKMFQSLIVYGNVRLLGKADAKFYQANDGRVVCRSIPMSFTFKNNHVTFTEDVTFTFNAEGKIESLAFALDNSTRESIFNNRARWSEKVRIAAASFIENYKTAYALKDIDYIRSIFDDYAIIVTGFVTMRSNAAGDQDQKGRKVVEYTRQNKQEYLERLAAQFKRNAYINLHLSDVTVKQMAKGGDLFALRIKQDYYSSTYADTGYLFLMVDLNNPDKPIIKLRAWQPERDPGVNPDSPLSKDDPLYGLVYEGQFQ